MLEIQSGRMVQQIGLKISRRGGEVLRPERLQVQVRWALVSSVLGWVHLLTAFFCQIGLDPSFGTSDQCSWDYVQELNKKNRTSKTKGGNVMRVWMRVNRLNNERNGGQWTHEVVRWGRNLTVSSDCHC